MDLKKFASREAATKGAVLYLKSPVDGEPLMTEGEKPQHVTITLIGQDSKEYSAARQRFSDQHLKEVVSSGVFQSKKVPITSAKMEGDELELAVLATKGWEHIEWEGAPLPFTQENVRKVYTECPWVLEQVKSFVSNRANFLGN